MYATLIVYLHHETFVILEPTRCIECIHGKTHQKETNLGFCLVDIRKLTFALLAQCSILVVSQDSYVEALQSA